MDLILFGPPGAGKGTQGELLSQRLGLRRLSTGDMLRDAVAAGTTLGREARRFMDAGELVPDDVILGMVREVLEGENGKQGVVFDGFPRTIAQAQALHDLLAELNRPLDAVLILEVPDEVLVKRLGGRMACPKCGTAYNLYYSPPAENMRCGICGSQLTQRPDDAPETVRRRLEVYRRQTAPLIDYYESSPVPVQRVDGDRAVEAVQHDLIGSLAA